MSVRTCQPASVCILTSHPLVQHLGSTALGDVERFGAVQTTRMEIPSKWQTKKHAEKAERRDRRAKLDCQQAFPFPALEVIRLQIFPSLTQPKLKTRLRGQKIQGIIQLHEANGITVLLSAGHVGILNPCFNGNNITTPRFHDETRLALDINKDICDRLSDPEDALLQHVRHLQTGPLKQEILFLNKNVLVKALDSLKYLRDFSWNVRFAIPEEILTVLSTKWPGARIHVANIDRSDQSGTYIPLDMKLLSSPQLYSLDYTVYGQSVSTSHRIFEFRSELAAFKKCLLQANNLRSLRLSVDDCNMPEQSCWSAGPKNFDFQEGDVFPALEKLVLQYQRYDLSETHCKQWLAAMDWTHLRLLDISCGAPPSLLTTLTGQVSQLKAMYFGFWYTVSSVGSSQWDCRESVVVTRFLDSIDGLEEVIINTFDREKFDEIRDSFLKKHGKTLRKLHVSHTAAAAQGWERPDVRSLVEHCPGLQDLALKIAMVTDTTADYRSEVWPEFTIAELQDLSHLLNLELELQVGELSHEFIVDSGANYFLIEKAAQNRATTLFGQLLANHSKSSIESLTVTFLVIIPVKRWGFVVTRNSGHGEGFVVKKRFVGTDTLPEVTPAGISFDPFS